LQKVEDRIHILEGRIAVLLNIDEVIRIIRESDIPKPALIEAFSLSDRQAEDILEIRLRQLARLEAIKIEQELAALRTEQSGLQDLLSNPGSMKRKIIKEIEADQKQFGDARRTLIEVAEKAVIEQKVIDEPVTVVISQKGWLRVRTAHGHDAAQFTFKAGDALQGTFECRSIDNLLAFGSNGRVYSVAVASLPGARGDGVPITSLVDLASGTRILHYFAGDATTILLLASTAGMGFTANVADMTGRMKAGKAFMNMDDGEELLAPGVVTSTSSAIACLSEKGRLLVFGLSEIKHLSSGGKGVILMELEAGEKLQAVQVISQKGVTVCGIGRASKPQEVSLSAANLAPHIHKRARKGRSLESKLKPTNLKAN
jgi:topoisomerase-4 subunit A